MNHLFFSEKAIIFATENKQFNFRKFFLRYATKAAKPSGRNKGYKRGERGIKGTIVLPLSLKTLHYSRPLSRGSKSPLSLPYKPFKPLGSGACETSVNNRSDMDTSSFPLSTDFLRDLGIIAQDESRMRRAIRYIKRLAAEKPDPTLMSKEEFSAKLERSEEQYRQGKYKAFTNIEDLDQYIRSL